VLSDEKAPGAAGMLLWSHRNCPASLSGDRGHPGVEISIRRSRNNAGVCTDRARRLHGVTDTPGLSLAISRAEAVFWWRHNVLGYRITPDRPGLPKFIVRGHPASHPGMCERGFKGWCFTTDQWFVFVELYSLGCACVRCSHLQSYQAPTCDQRLHITTLN